MNSRSITTAFVEASSKLGFAFESDVFVHGFRFLGLVRAFGSDRGTLVSALGDEPPPSIRERLAQDGYSFSILAETYEQFDEKLFRATLNDWGYRGLPTAKPAWYSGRAWQ